jgi:hypothetical protein
MATARITNEIVATIPSRVGLLADVCDAIREAGVNITAVSAYERQGTGKFLLVTSDNAKASAALGRLNAAIVDKQVVAIEMDNRPGALEEVARKMAEAGVNIEYAFGTATAGPGSTVIFKTDSDDKVVSLF